jgi:lactoylglutathione lyase
MRLREKAFTTSFGHLTIGVPDVAAVYEVAAKAGGTIPRSAGPVKVGTTIIAFVKDPDGYPIELVRRG